MNAPRASVVTRLRWYFERNPGEELSFRIIAQKYECSLRTAINAVQILKEEGYLEATHVIRLRIKGEAKCN